MRGAAARPGPAATTLGERLHAATVLLTWLASSSGWPVGLSAAVLKVKALKLSVAYCLFTTHLLPTK